MMDATVQTEKRQVLPEAQASAISTAIRTIMDRERANYRAMVKRASKGRGFYFGEQNGWWDDSRGRWRPASESPLYQEEDEARFQVVVNEYQAACLLVLAVLNATGIPGTKFFPRNPRNPEDISTARQSGTARELIYTENDMPAKWRKLGWLLFTDSLAVSYARHVRDERFGTITKDVQGMQSVEARPAGYECPACRKFSPGREIAAGVCPGCGAPIDPAGITPPMMAQVPAVIGQQKFPKGREIVTFYGVLETLLPHDAESIEDCGWVRLQVEISPELAKSNWPDFAEQIGAGPTASLGADDLFARNARLASRETGEEDQRRRTAPGASGEWVTHTRIWLRPAMFPAIEDKAMQAAFRQQFPEGVFLEYANDVLVNARAESMDDHLELFLALPGDGTNVPAVGGSFIPVQEWINDAYSMALEAAETASFAPVLRDVGMLSQDAVTKRMRPYEDVPVKVPAGKSLAEALFQPRVQDTSPSIERLIERGQQLSERLVGARGVLAGGSEANIDTAAAYSMAQAQAQQRLGLIYQPMRDHWPQIDKQLVAEFAACRTDDEVFAAGGTTGWEERSVSLQEMRGKVHTYPDNAGPYPVTPQQKQMRLERMMQNPQLAAIILHPSNVDQVFQLEGWEGLTIPGRDLRNKILADIKRLVQGMPTPQIDPATGQPVIGPDGRPALQPSLLPDNFLDDNQTVLSVVQEWAVSPDGLEARGDGPEPSPGYANVLAYGKYAQQQLQAAQDAQMQVQAAVAPPTPGQQPGPGSPPRAQRLPGTGPGVTPDEQLTEQAKAQTM